MERHSLLEDLSSGASFNILTSLGFGFSLLSNISLD